ncbi:N-acetyltransferase GCN5 [Thalassotalea eurytherma]|uniref:N-acetyltransferase GCN5 n=2 Tax=Thalassotalea eurytherma TaxID=1144278 RepID=A0ABQ6H711_9GAMM|nr:N-acetyltransferase GCN5 [Thalassotalea eurytherma]
MVNSMKVIKTSRLIIRPMALSDATFIHQLYNQSLFLKFIGNKQIDDIDAATTYILDGPQFSYKTYGVGLMTVSLHDGTPIGVCGLLQREDLPQPDLGYALDEAFYRNGYMKEACLAVLNKNQHMQNILAITSKDNEASSQLLKTLGFVLMEEGHKGYPDADIYQFITS